MFKSGFTRDIVAEEDYVGSPVEDASHWLERLLPSSVPYLEFNNFLIKFNDKRTEFHTYCDLVFQFKGVVLDLRKEATLSDT